MVSGVYKITNLSIDKCYVGSAVDFDKRWSHHRHDLRNNKHHSIHLQNAWNKYGEQNFLFEVLDVVTKPENLIKYEQLWIDQLKPEYNICPTAGNTLGRKFSEETKIRMSEIRKKRINKPHSIETCEKIRNALTGKKKSKEHCENLSLSIQKNIETRSGENHPLSKLTWEHVNEIRTNKILTPTQLAEKFGVKTACVYKILKNQAWKKNE